MGKLVKSSKLVGGAKRKNPKTKYKSSRGKIQNWSAGHVGPLGEIAWDHDTLQWNVDIENPFKGDWVVTVTGPDKEGRIICQDAKNEREARREAVDWMRTHPNPPAEEAYVTKPKEKVPWNHYNAISWQRKNIIIKIEKVGKWNYVKVYKDNEFYQDVYAFRTESAARRLVEKMTSGSWETKKYKKLRRMLEK